MNRAPLGFENAGKFATIGLAARETIALPPRAGLEFALDVRFAQRDSWRTTINDDAHAAAV
jgi:hypothetical protein